MEEKKETNGETLTESVGVTETPKDDGKIFATCPEKTCKRPYKKGAKYPLEVCGACTSMGIEFKEEGKNPL